MDLDHYYAIRIAQERTTHKPSKPTRVGNHRRPPIATLFRTAVAAISLPDRRFQPSTTPTR